MRKLIMVTEPVEVQSSRLSILPYPILRKPSFILTQLFLNKCYVFLNVTCWGEKAVESACFFLVVHVSNVDRYFRFEGDVVEAFFPVWVVFAGAFWGKEHVHRFIFFEDVDGEFGDVVVLFSVDGNAAQAFQNPSEGWKKQVLFDEDFHLHAEGNKGQATDDEIPIGGMGTDDNHGFLHTVWRVFINLPTK